MENINSVLVVAGTHGNELSGIYLHKLIHERLFVAERPSFNVNTVIANPKAVSNGIRFVDVDLNRQFTCDADFTKPSYEGQLAIDFKDSYAKFEQQLVVDLHNTTSNMGATLILLSDHPFYQQMGAYIKQRMKHANILFETNKSWEQQPYLCTVGKYGVIIEVGAQAHGALQLRTLELMKQMLSLVLDFVDKQNRKQIGELQDYHAYFYTDDVYLPLDYDGMRLAAVHPTICGKDFEPVKTGEPLLATFFGHDIYWEKPYPIYPHFINESAYYTANIAMALSEKKQVIVR